MFSIFRRKKKETPPISSPTNSDIRIMLDVSRDLENNIIEALDNPDVEHLEFISPFYIMQLNQEREAAIKSELPPERILEIILRIRQHHSQLKMAKNAFL